MTDTDINIKKYKSLTVKSGATYKVSKVNVDTVTLVDKEGVLTTVGDRYLLLYILMGDIVVSK